MVVKRPTRDAGDNRVSLGVVSCACFDVHTDTASWVTRMGRQLVQVRRLQQGILPGFIADVSPRFDSPPGPGLHVHIFVSAMTLDAAGPFYSQLQKIDAASGSLL